MQMSPQGQEPKQELLEGSAQPDFANQQGDSPE